jgi:hypothetical protein
MNVLWWVVACFAISACSITMARSAMMVPYRRLMLRFGAFTGALARCHYCTSHWLAAGVVAVYRPSIGGPFWADCALAWLALVGGSALLSGLIMFFTPFNSQE